MSLLRPISLTLSSSPFSHPPISLPRSVGVFMSENDRPLPKFGEWDVNDPASAEGFTVIFNKARDEKKTGGNTRSSDSPAKEFSADRQGSYLATKPNAKKWFCCMSSAAQS